MMQSEKNPFSSDFFFFAPSAAPAVFIFGVLLGPGVSLSAPFLLKPMQQGSVTPRDPFPIPRDGAVPAQHLRQTGKEKLEARFQLLLPKYLAHGAPA